MNSTKEKAGSDSAANCVGTVAVDRRSTPRITLPFVRAVVVSSGLPATVLEVGFGGLSTASEGEFTVGDTHELRCTVADQPAVVMRVQVRHCRRQDARQAPRYITGFQFIETWVPGDQSAVDTFIGQITIAASGE